MPRNSPCRSRKNAHRWATLFMTVAVATSAGLLRLYAAERAESSIASRHLTVAEMSTAFGRACPGCVLSNGTNCVGSPACGYCLDSMSKETVTPCTTPVKSYSGVQTQICNTTTPQNGKQCQKGNTRCWTEYNCNDSGLLVDVSCSNGASRTCTVVNADYYCRTCTVGAATGNFQDYENDACVNCPS